MNAFFIILSLLMSFIVVGCDKPNPEPEKIDPIYADIQSKLAEVNSQLKVAEKDLADKRKDLEKVIPQTGQNKFAQKRVEDSAAALDKLNQMKLYWELKLKTRKHWARQEYLKAFNKKEVWPNPQEIEEYRAQKKLEESSRTWDAKKRVADYSKPAEKPKKEGSGH